jgi:hypothetical protein
LDATGVSDKNGVIATAAAAAVWRCRKSGADTEICVVPPPGPELQIEVLSE